MIALTLTLLAPPALAWEHAGHAWTPAEDPLEYVTTDDRGADCLPGIGGGVCADTMAWAFDQWASAACVAAVPVDVGVGDPFDGVGPDGISSVTFGDASLEAGVTSMYAIHDSGIAFALDDQTYRHAVEFDAFLGAETAWATNEDVRNGRCEGAYNLDGELLRLAGNVLGMGPSFDPDVPSAMSVFDQGHCEPLSPLQADDVEGLNALYGPHSELACGTDGSPLQIGVVTMERNCAVSSDAPIRSATWSFGDGESDSGVAVTHQWRQEGLYTVRVMLEVDDPVCGQVETVAERIGYVRACDEPRARFSATHVMGRTYAIQNDTPIDVVGCITGVKWAIYEGAEPRGEPVEELESWEFRHEFPHDGTWTIVLNVGGPAGTRASAVTLDVVAHAGIDPFGCEHGAPAGGLGVALLALLGLRRRR